MPQWVDNESSQIKSEWKKESDRSQDLPIGYFSTHPLICIKDVKFRANCDIKENEFDTYRRMVREIFQLNYEYELHGDCDLFSNE